MSRRLPIALLLILATAMIHSPSAAAQPPEVALPTVELSGSLVTVRAAQPAGRVVLFGFGQEDRQHLPFLIRRDVLLDDADSDGTYELDFEREIPPASVWVAIELATGATGLAAPEGWPLRELSLSGKKIAKTLDRLELDLPMVEALVVRPGVGAWGLRAGDGGESDADGLSNGALSAAVDSMWRVGDSPEPPKKLATGDVLVIVDPRTLELVVARVDP